MPAAVELGVVVALEFEGRRIVWVEDDYPRGRRPRGPLLLWFPERSELVWDGEKLSPPRARPLSEDVDVKAAGELWRKWTRGREPGTQRRLEIDLRPGSTLGAARWIKYASNKWNTRDSWVLYKHTFEQGVSVSVRGEVYRVAGGRLRLTQDGIEG